VYDGKRGAPGAFQFFVGNLQGKLRRCAARGSDAVMALKQQLADREEVDVDAFRLVYAGQQLQDGQTLGHYVMWSFSTVHMCRAQLK
jgi:hypothetical protein